MKLSGYTEYDVKEEENQEEYGDDEDPSHNEEVKFRQQLIEEILQEDIHHNSKEQTNLSGVV